MDLLTGVTILLQLLVLASAQGKVPGTPCVTDIDCDPTTTFLECNPSTLKCRCKDYLSSVFDYGAGICTIRAQALCTTPPGPTDMTCTPNSICGPVAPGNPVTICNCDTLVSSFHISYEGRCVRYSNETCDPANRECDPEKFLACDPSTRLCSCNPGSFYEPVWQKCVKTLTSTCTQDTFTEPCQVFAVCVPSSNVCSCGSGFTQVGQDCVHRYGDQCVSSPKDSCSPYSFLKCSGTTCQCQNTLTQYYETASQQCKIKANEACVPQQTPSPPAPLVPECTRDATCELVPTTAYACKCNPLLQVSKYQKCVLAYGNSCVYGNDKCDADNFHACDPVTSTCACQNKANSWYDPLTGECFLLADAPCVPLTTDPLAQRCVPRSSCTGTVGTSKCTCDGGIVPNPDRQCYLPFGSVCNEQSDNCDVTAFLACNPATRLCECKDANNTIFDAATRTCRLKAQRPCSTNLNQQQCVPNAICTPQVNGQTICQCDVSLGLRPSTNGMCRLWHDAPCLANGGTQCDEAGFQSCNTATGRCACADASMEYNSGDATCYVMTGSPCSTAQGSAPCKLGLQCVNGICACDSTLGFVDDGTGTCKKTYGFDCTTALDCNTNAFLECRNSTCLCRGGYANVPATDGRQRCVGLINAVCAQNQDCHVDNSIVCTINNLCNCYDLSIQEFENANQRCVSKPDQKCHLSSSNLGTDIAPLNCVTGYSCVNYYSNVYGTCSCYYGNMNSSVCTGGSDSLSLSHAWLVILLSAALLR